MIRNCYVKIVVYLLFISTLQIILVIVDHTPRYLFGDSGSYVWAIEHGGPSDRSWTYPAWFLKPILYYHSIVNVVYVQCALSIVPPILCWRLIRDDGRGSPAIALVFSVLCLLEPLGLTYQRFILTDSLGAFFVAIALYLCARIVDAKPWPHLAAAAAPPAMVLACSLRGCRCRASRCCPY